MATVVNVHEAKTQLSRLLALVERGEEVIIARHGQPVARLSAVNLPERRPGSGRGTIRWSPAGFELGDDELAAFEAPVEP